MHQDDSYSPYKYIVKWDKNFITGNLTGITYYDSCKFVTKSEAKSFKVDLENCNKIKDLFGSGSYIPSNIILECI